VDITIKGQICVTRSEVSILRSYEGYADLPGGRVILAHDLREIARRLRSNPRRLRRHLARAGETFQQIRMRLGGELAGAFLLAADSPITTVGYKVGFVEPGGFTRNFLAWSGMSPSEYRRQHKSDSTRVAVATTLLLERCKS
jgi:AraC-like DNA-binding protein